MTGKDRLRSGLQGAAQPDKLRTDGMTMNRFQVTFQSFAVKVYYISLEDDISVKKLNYLS